MPKVSKTLSFKEIIQDTRTRFAIGGVKGLYFFKNNNQNKQSYFYFRYVDSSKIRRELPLFKCDINQSLTRRQQNELLQRAQGMAIQASLDLLHGIDPIDKKNASALKPRKRRSPRAKETPFRTLMAQWIKAMVERNQWVNPTRESLYYTNSISKYMANIMDVDASTITPRLVADCLGTIWQTQPKTAYTILSAVSRIFRWAMAQPTTRGSDEKKWNISSNPADPKGEIKELLSEYQSNKAETQHHSACDVDEVPLLMKTLYNKQLLSAHMAMFQILTATRSQAVRFCQISEIDSENSSWSIPITSDKMKGINRDRTIYLSSQAKRILKEIEKTQAIKGNNAYVFQSPRKVNTPFGNSVIKLLIDKLHEERKASDGIGWVDSSKMKKLKNIEELPNQRTPSFKITLHGTARASFRTWARNYQFENGGKLDQKAVELCLLHQRKDAIIDAYDRADLEKERRQIMELWGEYCFSLIDADAPKD